MAKLEVKLEVSKEIYELGKGLGDFVTAIKGALDDGWQAEQDLPVLLTEAITKLAPAVQGIELIDDEWAEDKEAAIQAILVSLMPALFDVMAKKEDVPAATPAS